MERFARLLFLLVFCFGGYYVIGLNQDPAQASTLMTSLDEQIPFIPESIYVYASIYVFMMLPIFVVRDIQLFRRVVVAYVAVILVCLVCFLLFPVTSLPLRPDPSTLNANRFHEWGLLLNYHLDPPMNLFPSLHIGIASISALSVWRAHRDWGRIALVTVGLILVSTCTVKQHYWVDGAAGLLLGFVVYARVLHAYPVPGRSQDELAFTWRGPAIFFALVAMILALLFVAFQAGIRPWE